MTNLDIRTIVSLSCIKTGLLYVTIGDSHQEFIFSGVMLNGLRIMNNMVSWMELGIHALTLLSMPNFMAAAWPFGWFQKGRIRPLWYIGVLENPEQLVRLGSLKNIWEDGR